jgi:hypothetical protein
MYRSAIAELALQGQLDHGGLSAYLGDHRASKGVFEMYVADRLTRTRGVRFWRFDDLAPAMMGAMHLLPRELDADGEDIDCVDVTDCQTCIAHCRRSARLDRTCGTILASALGLSVGPDGRESLYVKWQSVVLARNSCATLTYDLRRLFKQAPDFDMPIDMSEFHAYVVECVHLLVLRSAYTVLRCRLPRDLTESVLAFA